MHDYNFWTSLYEHKSFLFFKSENERRTKIFVARFCTCQQQAQGYSLSHHVAVEESMRNEETIWRKVDVDGLCGLQTFKLILYAGKDC